MLLLVLAKVSKYNEENILRDISFDGVAKKYVPTKTPSTLYMHLL